MPIRTPLKSASGCDCIPQAPTGAQGNAMGNFAPTGFQALKERPFEWIPPVPIYEWQVRRIPLVRPGLQA